MVRRRVPPRAILTLLVLGFSGQARAETTSVWYRAGEGCPEGTSFIERLERRGVAAGLAGPGDRIDFIVTLGHRETQSIGTLERQTLQGTVAMRQVDGTDCHALADILALTLALAVEPAAKASEPIQQPEAAPSPEPVPAPAPPPALETKAPSETTTARAVPPRPEPARFALGVEGAAWNLIASAWLVSGGVVGEWRPALAWRPSLRAGLRGGAAVGGDRPADFWLAASRWEACPVALGDGAFELRPCAAADLGALGASAAGEGDAAFWAALAAHLRLGSTLSPGVRVELQGGAVAPLTSYEVTAGEPARTLEKTKVVGLAFGAGAMFSLP